MRNVLLFCTAACFCGLLVTHSSASGQDLENRLNRAYAAKAYLEFIESETVQKLEQDWTMAVAPTVKSGAESCSIRVLHDIPSLDFDAMVMCSVVSAMMRKMPEDEFQRVVSGFGPVNLRIGQIYGGAVIDDSASDSDSASELCDAQDEGCHVTERGCGLEQAGYGLEQAGAMEMDVVANVNGQRGSGSEDEEVGLLTEGNLLTKNGLVPENGALTENDGLTEAGLLKRGELLGFVMWIALGENGRLVNVRAIFESAELFTGLMEDMAESLNLPMGMAKNIQSVQVELCGVWLLEERNSREAGHKISHTQRLKVSRTFISGFTTLDLYEALSVFRELNSSVDTLKRALACRSHLAELHNSAHEFSSRTLSASAVGMVFGSPETVGKTKLAILTPGSGLGTDVLNGAVMWQMLTKKLSLEMVVDKIDRLNKSSAGVVNGGGKPLGGGKLSSSASSSKAASSSKVGSSSKAGASSQAASSPQETASDPSGLASVIWHIVRKLAVSGRLTADQALALEAQLFADVLSPAPRFSFPYVKGDKVCILFGSDRFLELVRQDTIRRLRGQAFKDKESNPDSDKENAQGQENAAAQEKAPGHDLGSKATVSGEQFFLMVVYPRTKPGAYRARPPTDDSNDRTALLFTSRSGQGVADFKEVQRTAFSNLYSSEAIAQWPGVFHHAVALSLYSPLTLSGLVLSEPAPGALTSENPFSSGINLLGFMVDNAVHAALKNAILNRQIRMGVNSEESKQALVTLVGSVTQSAIPVDLHISETHNTIAQQMGCASTDTQRFMDRTVLMVKTHPLEDSDWSQAQTVAYICLGDLYQIVSQARGVGMDFPHSTRGLSTVLVGLLELDSKLLSANQHHYILDFAESNASLDHRSSADAKSSIDHSQSLDPRSPQGSMTPQSTPHKPTASPVKGSSGQALKGSPARPEHRGVFSLVKLPTRTMSESFSSGFNRLAAHVESVSAMFDALGLLAQFDDTLKSHEQVKSDKAECGDKAEFGEMAGSEVDDGESSTPVGDSPSPTGESSSPTSLLSSPTEQPLCITSLLTVERTYGTYQSSKQTKKTEGSLLDLGAVSSSIPFGSERIYDLMLNPDNGRTRLFDVSMPSFRHLKRASFLDDYMRGVNDLEFDPLENASEQEVGDRGAEDRGAGEDPFKADAPVAGGETGNQEAEQVDAVRHVLDERTGKLVSNDPNKSLDPNRSVDPSRSLDRSRSVDPSPSASDTRRANDKESPQSKSTKQDSTSTRKNQVPETDEPDLNREVQHGSVPQKGVVRERNEIYSRGNEHHHDGLEHHHDGLDAFDLHHQPDKSLSSLVLFQGSDWLAPSGDAQAESAAQPAVAIPTTAVLWLLKDAVESSVGSEEPVCSRLDEWWTLLHSTYDSSRAMSVPGEPIKRKFDPYLIASMNDRGMVSAAAGHYPGAEAFGTHPPIGLVLAIESVLSESDPVLHKRARVGEYAKL